MKCIIKLFASATMGVILLTACKGTGVISTPDQMNHLTQSESIEISDTNLKIAIISSVSGIDDGNFNEDIYNGIESFIKKNPGSEVTPIREMSGDPEIVVETVAETVAEYDVIVCCGFQFSGIGQIANKYPNKKFILVDAFPTNENGATAEFNNIYAMEFRDQESGFLAGVAAAIESRTKKVAVVTGMPYPSNVNYQYGFESGVNYSNGKYYTGVECVELHLYSGTDIRHINVGGNYIGSFSDKEKGKQIGKELIAQGCDIIFVAAGEAGKGVFNAVKEDKNAKQIKVIGCDVDQYDDGKDGNNNIILTSALKNMHINVEKQLEAIAHNTFKGENAMLGADTDSTGYIKQEGRNQLLSYTRSKLDEAYNLIKIGKIIPASNFNGVRPEDFIGVKLSTDDVRNKMKIVAQGD